MTQQKYISIYTIEIEINNLTNKSKCLNGQLTLQKSLTMRKKNVIQILKIKQFKVGKL